MYKNRSFKNIKIYLGVYRYICMYVDLNTDRIEIQHYNNSNITLQKKEVYV